jgi:ribosome-associated protein
MIKITPNIALSESEVIFTFIRASGPGGQNVNKVATAALLRFNVMRSDSLPEDVRTRLLSHLGKKITTEGELLIKADRYRTQERNKQDALQRLAELIRHAAIPPKKRKKTKPSYGSVQRRLSTKKLHSKNKSLRNKAIHD